MLLADIQYFAGEANLNFTVTTTITITTTPTICYLVLAYLWFVAISRGDTSFITFIRRRRRRRRHKHWPWKRFSRTQNPVTLLFTNPLRFSPLTIPSANSKSKSKSKLPVHINIL